MTSIPAADRALTRAWQDRWRAALMDNYGTPSTALVRGSGARVWDAEGREYVDLLAGIAVNAVGHAHPAVVDAIHQQASTLGHTSNLAINPRAVELAERLLDILTITSPDDRRGQGRVFLCNSGAEANEAAFKIARRTGRSRIVVAQRSFHGRTMGALALTAQPAKQEPFRPLPGEVVDVPFGDAQALRTVVDEYTAAVFLEPIQGEGGVIPAPDGYLAAARQACDGAGALLVLDEVQTGIGRTGEWFAFQGQDVEPDVVTLAKGLGGGMPLGACVAFGDAAGLLQPGQHGSTFGGNPMACAAGLAVIDTIDKEGLLERVAVVSERLQRIVATSSIVDHVRGRGLLLGVVLTQPLAAQMESACREEGLLVNNVADDVVRLAPPLTLTDDDLELVSERWSAAAARLA